MNIAGWESFEPPPYPIEEIEYGDLWRAAAQIPQDWYQYDGEGLFQLIEMLYQQRSLVRDLITAFRNSMRRPLPSRKQLASNLDQLKNAIHAEPLVSKLAQKS